VPSFDSGRDRTYGATAATSSVGRGVFSSAGRGIFRLARIGRSADDNAAARVYGGDVRKADVYLAAILLVAAELQVWLTDTAGDHRNVAALVAPVLTATVAIRRHHPAFAGIVAQVSIAVAFAVWSDTQILGTSIAWFCSLYALTVWTPTRQFVAGAAIVAATNLAAAAGPSGTLQRSTPFAVVTLVVMVLVRRVVLDRERRAELAERERDVVAREAVVEERARIARELHDAIAHNVSMMVVQAGAERRVVGEANPSTQEVLQTIEHIGRGALTEMRRLVGMLRSDAADPLVPQPALRDLPTLVAQVTDAGLPVELRIEGERRELAVGIELSAYRIVQEALTNTLKHAGDAKASVRVRYGRDSLELEISDDGGTAREQVVGGGHGLVGMRERVALYGGSLDAARRPTGGFTVRVLLPIR
jgi:signal transduction histidine kinase